MRDILSDSRGAELAGRILGLLQEGGATAYLGQPVTQLEHALQAAALADSAGASDALVLAALLHDIGHLLTGGTAVGDYGGDRRHEHVGSHWLSDYFDPVVTAPVGLHVAAKRYLCAVEPAYASTLSEASQESLALQGGPMNGVQRLEFERSPWAKDAVALRRWDDAAKVPGLMVPELSHYRRRIERLLHRSRIERLLLEPR